MASQRQREFLAERERFRAQLRRQLEESARHRWESIKGMSPGAERDFMVDIHLLMAEKYDELFPDSASRG